MKRVYITPTNVVKDNTSKIVTANGTADVAYTSAAAAYASSGCSGQSECGGYSAVMSCLVQIYQGVRTCGTMLLLDKDGNPLDTDRLESVDVTLMNEYGCAVYWFSSTGEEEYNPVTFIQTRVGGEIVACYEYAEFARLVNDETTFIDNCELVEDSSESPLLVIGANDGYGSIILSDITSEGEVYLEMDCGDHDSPFVKWDGLPRGKIGERTLLENICGCESHVLEFYGRGAIKSFELSGDIAVVNKGKILLCIEGYESSRMMPANLSAYITLKFKDDDAEEQGAVHIVDCVRFGRVYRNYNLSEGLETPLESYEVRPDHISYDNSASGLQAVNVKDAIAELSGDVDKMASDKYREIYIEPDNVVLRDGEFGYGYYWELRHELKCKDVNVRCFAYNGSGGYDEVFGYDVELYSEDVAYVKFVNGPERGFAIVN